MWVRSAQRLDTTYYLSIFLVAILDFIFQAVEQGWIWSEDGIIIKQTTNVTTLFAKISFIHTFA